MSIRPLLRRPRPRNPTVRAVQTGERANFHTGTARVMSRKARPAAQRASRPLPSSTIRTMSGVTCLISLSTSMRSRARSTGDSSVNCAVIVSRYRGMAAVSAATTPRVDLGTFAGGLTARSDGADLVGEARPQLARQVVTHPLETDELSTGDRLRNRLTTTGV